TSLKADADATAAAYSRLKAVADDMQKTRSGLLATLERDQARYASLSKQYSGIYIWKEFFEKRHADKQKAAPWLDEKTARLRHDVFEAAMELHRAFIDAAVRPVRHNLNALMDGFGVRSLGNAERDALIPHLWSTLFLLVPVVS